MSAGRRDTWRWKAATAVMIVALLACAVALQYSLESSTGASGADDSTPFEAGRSILDVLGGVRQSLAAILWTKTDAIYHDYYGASLEKENLIFPYYWLITRLDPNFEMPFYFSSYILCRFGKVKEGFDLALEGIRHNPNSSVLQQSLAEIYLFFKRDPEKALYHINRAIALEKDSDPSSAMTAAVPETFKKLVESVIAGDAKIPSVKDIEDLKKQKHLENCEECQDELEEGHKHEH